MLKRGMEHRSGLNGIFDIFFANTLVHCLLHKIQTVRISSGRAIIIIMATFSVRFTGIHVHHSKFFFYTFYYSQIFVYISINKQNGNELSVVIHRNS